MGFPQDTEGYAMQTLRLYFKKQQDAIYLSHLDLVRCFTKATRRSGLDIWYTQGFNSRPYLQFAIPLPLGVSSVYEVVDIRFNTEVTKESIFKKLIQFSCAKKSIIRI